MPLFQGKFNMSTFNIPNTSRDHKNHKKDIISYRNCIDQKINIQCDNAAILDFKNMTQLIHDSLSTVERKKFRTFLASNVYNLPDYVFDELLLLFVAIYAFKDSLPEDGKYKFVDIPAFMPSYVLSPFIKAFDEFTIINPNIINNDYVVALNNHIARGKSRKSFETFINNTDEDDSEKLLITLLLCH